MTCTGIFDQWGAGGLQNAAGSLGGLMGSQQSAFERQLAAAQISDQRAQQMNAAMAQMVQHQMNRDRDAAMRQMMGNVGRDLYEEFTNRYVATPEAAKKCPPPRDPKKCPPPKPIPKEYMESIDAWMAPKPGNIYHVTKEALNVGINLHDTRTNRDKLRAEVAAWTRRAA